MAPRIPFRTETLERFIFWAGAAALLVPALYVPQFLYPYIFGRAIFFHIVVELMAAVWILLLTRQPERYKPRLHWSGIFFAIFLGISLLSSLFGVDPGRSIWGTELRMTGWFTFAHSFLYLLVLSSVIRSERDWRRLFSISALVIGAMALLSFGERFSLAFRAAIFGGERVLSTTGNPIFFSAILLFGIAFSAWLAATTRGRSRVLWILVVAAESAALAFTETRGATVAFFLTLFALLVVVVVCSKTKRIRLTALGAIALIILSIAVAWSFRETRFIKRSLPQIYRLASTPLLEGTSATRLITWGLALDGIRARPILGWGMGNFNVVFDHFYRPELLRHGFYETVSDRPHNGLLEVAIDSGALGLAAYSAIFAAAIFGLFRGYRKRLVDAPTALAFGGGLFVYQIQNFFALDTPNTLMLVGFAFAYLQWRLASSPPESSHEAHQAQVPAAALTLLFAIVLPFSYIGNIAPLLDSYQAGLAADVAGRDPILWKDPALRAIRSKGPHAREMRVATTRDFLNWEGTGKLPENVVRTVVDSFIAEMRKSTAVRSVTFQERFMLAQLLMIRGEYFKDAQAYADAEAELQLAANLSPERQAVPFFLGRLYLITERPEEVVRVLGEVLAEDPTVAEAHWFHGLGLIATGKRAEGIASLEESLRRGRSLSKSSEIQYLIDLYAEEERYESLIPLYEQLIVQNPTAAEPHASLATTYAKLGKNALAILEAQRAVELDPSFAGAAENFIRSLQQ